MSINEQITAAVERSPEHGALLYRAMRQEALLRGASAPDVLVHTTIRSKRAAMDALGVSHLVPWPTWLRVEVGERPPSDIAREAVESMRTLEER